MKKGNSNHNRRYTVVYSACRDGGYTAFFPAFPEITVWYPTLKECKKAAPEALAIHIEGLIALGEKVPKELLATTESVAIGV